MKGLEKGFLYIVSAPSGAGKTSLVEALVNSDPSLCVSVSHTTRPPREGEVDGENYHFIQYERFLSMLSDGDFLESAEVYGHHYGTSHRWLNEQLEMGKNVILEIDWQGAEQVRNLYPQVCSIFIMPPSVETLRQRLESRGKDDEETINRRMAKAVSEISHVAESDFIVVNDEFEQALRDLQSVVRAHQLTVENQQTRQSALLTSLGSAHR